MSETFPTAVVTGASRGFGRAIAAALVAAGTPVIGIAQPAVIAYERAGSGGSRRTGSRC
jgi:NAD(P)-dependent dehydrogenase (short-subunit alcohol dehydrogenase family)